MNGQSLKRGYLLGLVLLAGLLLIPALHGTGADGQAIEAWALEEKVRRANVPDGMWILINVNQKALTLYHGVETVKRYAIATGTGETPTPLGIYRITHRFAGDLGGFGTRFLGLNVPWGQFGIHGTNKPGSIGSNASHGCIRMHVKDSEELYGKAPNGTLVIIEGGAFGQLDGYLRGLRTGDRNSHVAAVQRRLQVLGYYDGAADGIYGRGTVRAVARARRALGLSGGDEVDAAFYKAIGLILYE